MLIHTVRVFLCIQFLLGSDTVDFHALYNDFDHYGLLNSRVIDMEHSRRLPRMGDEDILSVVREEEPLPLLCKSGPLSPSVVTSCDDASKISGRSQGLSSEERAAVITVLIHKAVTGEYLIVYKECRKVFPMINKAKVAHFRDNLSRNTFIDARIHDIMWAHRLDGLMGDFDKYFKTVEDQMKASGVNVVGVGRSRFFGIWFAHCIAPLMSGNLGSTSPPCYPDGTKWKLSKEQIIEMYKQHL